MRNANVSQIIVTMTSPTLNPNGNNATFQIFSKYSESKVFFRHVQIEKIVEDIPSVSNMLDKIAKPKFVKPNENVNEEDLKIVNFR